MCQELSDHLQNCTSKVIWKTTNCSNETKCSVVKNIVETTPSVSERQLAQQLNVSYDSVQKILKNKLSTKPDKIQIVQKLQADDFVRK